MKKIWSFLSISNFRSGAAWIFFAIGLLLYFIGFKDDPSLSFSKIAIKIADVLVIGALVGFLANAARFLGIFKQDLQDIIYGNDFVKKRNDIIPLWVNVSKTLINFKFPNIQDSFLKTIIDYMPVESRYYIENYDINTTVSWIDRNKGIVKAVDTIAFDIISDSIDHFFFPIYTWTIIKENQQEKSVIREILLNGQPVIFEVLPDKKEIDEGNRKENRISLSGNTKYSIKYIREKEYNINVDYYIAFKAKCIVNNLRVNLVLPNDIEALFTSKGTQNEYNDIITTPNRIAKKYFGIILPKQGHIFALKRKK